MKNLSKSIEMAVKFCYNKKMKNAHKKEEHDDKRDETASQLHEARC